MNKKFIVAGIGELLWDVFPHRARIGGAPANFAWHCGQIGAQAYPISCIGHDAMGQRMRTELAQSGVATDYLITNEKYPTGQAKVTFDTEGKPNYEIVMDAAWDHLTLTAELKQLAQNLDAVSFGSLAQRSTASRETIQAFIEGMPEQSLKIFDVNLRQSFHSKQLIERSLQIANILKLSDEELDILAGYFNLNGPEIEQLQQLQARFDLRLLVYTRGSKGSQLLTAETMHETPCHPVDMIDSVGAGDSFTAAICMGLLHQWPLNRINIFANQVASFVCSQTGATPILPQQFTLSK
ncbi:carbohydrate kinase [Coraliomargarita sp. SDUM461004]|uniref:Carbohydrate kinase n=1 Tax=Thalassobacterium sedimentorum TaxID=3041258 RepID=A0ABU1ALE7_9BACT|nr:carbohydrate kinase [Coraliomargarita sp. SDUM461004]MDQ8195613.1 carbohydrate kinase [Coraliomargarita sp. SDUM461004]